VIDREEPQPAFRFVYRTLKVLASLVGLGLSILGLMALVGAITANLIVQLAIALLVLLPLPPLFFRWLIGARLPRTRGLLTDLLAVLWLGIAVALIGFGGSAMRPLMQREARRFTQSEDPRLGAVGGLVSWLSAMDLEPRHDDTTGSSTTARGRRG
jgi:hypothetical protein